MSSEALPITSARFASALSDLSIESLHAKVAELRNSIAHLENSNKELEQYARENDDRECYEYLLENRQVMKRFEERIELIRREIVENRGMPFEPQEAKVAPPTQNGTSTQATTNGAQHPEEQRSTGADGNDEDDGVYL